MMTVVDPPLVQLVPWLKVVVVAPTALVAVAVVPTNAAVAGGKKKHFVTGVLANGEKAEIKKRIKCQLCKLMVVILLLTNNLVSCSAQQDNHDNIVPSYSIILDLQFQKSKVQSLLKMHIS